MGLFVDTIKRPLRRRVQIPASYHYKGLDIPLRLVRRRRRKYMAIHVLRGGVVEVRAPLKCPNDEIDFFIRSRLDWIQNAREEMFKLPPKPERQYLQGELQPYLGSLYRLHLIESRRHSVEPIGDQLMVGSTDPGDNQKTRDIIHKWYKQEALSMFPHRVRLCLEVLDGNPDIPPITVRKMKSRWGSCSRNGRICLNSMLVQKPIDAIDFVIMHELCHLTHFNHGAGFYNLMDQLMPDWRVRESKLEEKKGWVGDTDL